jgi:hypothetical protein
METLFVAAVHEEKTHQDLLDLVSNSGKNLITCCSEKAVPGVDEERIQEDTD